MPDFSTSQKPKILWANHVCLLDTSSGAAISVREMLQQLVNRGCDVKILGATLFDAEVGAHVLAADLQSAKEKGVTLLEVADGPLAHQLVVTQHFSKENFRAKEINYWYHHYIQLLDTFQPDLVYTFGGQATMWGIANEAKARGIFVAAYLANGNYTGQRWCRDIDLILTNSRSNAQYYATSQGYQAIPVGPFINPVSVLAPSYQRQRLLFVNPSLAKGAGVVIMLALMLGKRRPDIQIEVVKSRGDWTSLVRLITASQGQGADRLENVTVTPNTRDMRPIYGRARLLLAPSLWWESSGRVLVEAMLNGIPPLVTDRGGMPELVQDGGIKIQFPPEFHEPPYQKVPSTELLEPLLEIIIRLYDDQQFYETLSKRAAQIAQEQHGIEASSRRLLQAVGPFLGRRKG